MTLTAKTRFNIGDTAYFLNAGQLIAIVKCVITKIECKIVNYKSPTTGKCDNYISINYHVNTGNSNDIECNENELYTSPHEILSTVSDQVEQGDFD